MPAGTPAWSRPGGAAASAARRRPGPRPGGLLIAALVPLAGCGAGATPGALPRPSPTAVTSSYATTATRPVVHTTLGQGMYGVRSATVIAENARPGDPSWRILKEPRTGSIRGFADRTYAARGQQVVLRVSTTAPAYRVTAYRVGWYGGAGARAVWHSPRLAARPQPACRRSPGINMVSCADWRPSLTVRVTAAFVPGDYLFKLVGSGGQQSYVPLTVWDPHSRAAYVIKNDVFTWQAWNTYGGYDYYAGRGTCPPGVYPLCTRARVVSFDRPYDRHGANAFLTLEAPLVRLMEEHGLDVTYLTDVTVDQHPDVLRAHRAVLSLGHDECWSLRERSAAVRAERHGLNVAFFGASGMLRHVRLEASPLGQGRRLVDYRDGAADPLNGHGNPLQVTGNTWSDPPASWPENDFVGESYNGFLEPGTHAALTVTEPTSWVFAGTGLRAGARLPGAVASDVDSLQPGLGHPADVEVLAHSALPGGLGQSVSGPGTFFSDMTYYTDPHNHAGVWDSGTNNWIPGLVPGGPEPGWVAADLARITGNVLRGFGNGPAGLVHPSHATWRRIYP